MHWLKITRAVNCRLRSQWSGAGQVSTEVLIEPSDVDQGSIEGINGDSTVGAFVPQDPNHP